MIQPMRLFPNCISIGLSSLAVCQLVNANDFPRVIPRPQIENHGDGMIRLGTQRAGLKIHFENTSPTASAACGEGSRILSRRLGLLGCGDIAVEKHAGSAQIVIAKVSPRKLQRQLRSLGANENLTGKRLEQAYALECVAGAKGRGTVSVTGCGDLGIYYGLVSLCQLLDHDEQGGTSAPEVRIADWPEIGLRLAKTSASTLSLPQLTEFAAWLPFYKMNIMGLQFHGTNSLQPGPFTNNVRSVCSQARRDGILETIVYFCPFRGNGYDFNRPEDRLKYSRFLQWMLDQGANGIEVDYNDWPGKGTPIEDVINLACRAVQKRNPKAYILYCPPSRGASMYRGPASAEMIRILSHVPTKVWPLWTGMATRNALIEKPLDPADVEAWTRDTGRRPFLWVNRVVTRDLPQKRPFARPVDEVPGAYVFRGEFLPKELNRLFEGIHFNAGTPSKSDPEFLAYLATAADYVWNPKGWEAVESCRRAKRFVEVMSPLERE